ncbi:MAG: transcription antitermination factor NusB [Candidatus Saganbacteria bacterium]|nr:transcription antitermination factor NusB [Candidatus Saganbacteria bacterium]
MGKRTTSRRLAMQALFQADHAGEEIEKALKDVLESDKFLGDTKEFAGSLAVETYKNRSDLDTQIKKYLKDWTLDRISGVDRSILRLSFYELGINETPSSVVINEAINLAQKYSGVESVKFINGVLGAYLKCGQKKA